MTQMNDLQVRSTSPCENLWKQKLNNIRQDQSHHQKKMEDDFVMKYTARINKETELAPSGQCKLWTECTSKGKRFYVIGHSTLD